MHQLMKKNRIVAIMRGIPWEKTLDYANALVEGGVHVVEVALNFDSALNQIRLIKQNFGGRLTVGAGTATTCKRAYRAVEAGADFLLSPSANPEVMDFCSEHEIMLLPGVMTPTDVSICVSHGYRTLKLFPAGDLPMSFIKSLKGPFEDTEYVAVGGIRKETVKAYLDAGFLGVGVGKGLIPRQYLENEDWEGAAAAVREFTAAAFGARMLVHA